MKLYEFDKIGLTTFCKALTWHKTADILEGPRQFVERHFVEYDIWWNKTTGRM